MIHDTPRILIVDNEVNLCAVIQRILEREGYRVITTNGGTEALKLIPDFRPDIVLLDLMLPDISGHELCRLIREISSCRVVYFTPIVGLKTAEQPKGLKELHKNADGVINKPASMKQIVTMVNNTLAQQ